MKACRDTCVNAYARSITETYEYKCTTEDACACVGLCARSLECLPAHTKSGPSNTSRFREFDFEVGSDERGRDGIVISKRDPDT